MCALLHKQKEYHGRGSVPITFASRMLRTLYACKTTGSETKDRIYFVNVEYWCTIWFWILWWWIIGPYMTDMSHILSSTKMLENLSVENQRMRRPKKSSGEFRRPNVLRNWHVTINLTIFSPRQIKNLYKLLQNVQVSCCPPRHCWPRCRLR